MISGFRLMWMMVMFDLPVVEKIDRKAASKFRKFLLDEGFDMCQFSVYMKFCGTRERTNKYVHKIKDNSPTNGKVSILFFTDKQFGNIINIFNRERYELPKRSEQYVLFEDISSEN
jgi:CRISPR-associated protein Cas2